MRLFDTALKMISGEIPIDANERFVEPAQLLTGAESDWKRFIETEWAKDFDKEVSKALGE
jgi:hypothetical protein